MADGDSLGVELGSLAIYLFLSGITTMLFQVMRVKFYCVMRLRKTWSL